MTRPSKSSASANRLTLREPWVLTRSPTISGAGSCCMVTARIMRRDRRRQRRIGRATARAGFELDRTICRMCSGLDAAATADDADPELLDHLAQAARPIDVRLQRELGEPIDIDRDAGVRNDRDRPGRVLAEIAGRLAHVLRTGRCNSGR